MGFFKTLFVFWADLWSDMEAMADDEEYTALAGIDEEE